MLALHSFTSLRSPNLHKRLARKAYSCINARLIALQVGNTHLVRQRLGTNQPFPSCAISLIAPTSCGPYQPSYTNLYGRGMYLGGNNSVHDRRIRVTGEAYIRVGLPNRPEFRMHVNRAEAEGHIARIREFEKDEKMRVVFPSG